ncbi:PQQ-dependent sugar dehydrogenase [Oligoflexus tunisiensis]|uniref:PQQ-dependent sugar dehydrogenase n=1 Tax=Oligoflexus tunisiensis TaxID=708132 RepID=UPI000A82F01D|nr:sorbosone dehydrogenase family protein [Oligoflexus tunisiensis]
MKAILPVLAISGSLLLLNNCKGDDDEDNDVPPPADQGQEAAGLADGLPVPNVAHDARTLSKVLGWPADKKPVAPAGFEVKEFAGGLENPRNTYALPNGDILVVESNTKGKGPQEENLDPNKAARRGQSADRITILRDTNGDGVSDSRALFLSGLNQPFGIALVGEQLFVANTDSLMVFPYKTGDVVINFAGRKILDLPAGGYNNHWTRNLLVSPDQTKLYISVGSASNIAEHGLTEETRRANILQVNLDGSGEKVFASGLRNPVGMDWNPETGELWSVVNERDFLGDDLVPDFLTSVKENSFYGWPYSYFGQNLDPRVPNQNPQLVAAAVVPDVPLGAHTASLGLAFARGENLPDAWDEGAFIAQHGSWNRTTIAGYKVVFQPFEDGKPSGALQDFLTGFVVNAATAEVYGRPVSVRVLDSGIILVADDSGDKVWSVVPLAR